MMSSTLLVTPEVSVSTPVHPRWALGVLLAIALLERLCMGTIQTGLALGLLAPLGYSVSSTQELLVGFSLLNASMLLVGGWVADLYWGVRRTLLVGALLVAIGFGALAGVFWARPAAFGGNDSVLLPMLLALPAMGAGLLLPGLLVAVAGLGRFSLRTLARDFLLIRLVAGLASIILPLVIGTVVGRFGAGWILGSAGCLAALLVLLLVRYRYLLPPAPSVSSKSLIRQYWGVLPGLILILRAAGGSAKMLTVLLGSLFLGTLGYLAWSTVTPRAGEETQPAPRKLLVQILGVFGLSLLLAVVTKAGYTVAPEPRQLMIWSLVPMGALLGLFLWTRWEPQATGGYRLWNAGLILAGVGAIPVLLVLLQYFEVGAGLSAFQFERLAATLPLHTAIICLLFLLPILISLYGPATTRARLMALCLVLSTVAAELVAGLVASIWPY
ncbi:hypothetical protein LGH70_17640 [Hymenobacter sp. BT635]|uniref:MFS transporter n=1 Tax=Hymenobacter nitidus TaxID=2880929 RepID=A0ABS8AGP3_9BACT|nr:hypothetical protein [Hymenobacter nitidus]MCB2379426.1 hypothetical protein [Hymenobacter nitidus]